MLVNFQQKEIPKPDDTAPGKEYGTYSFEEFFFENWGYITVVVIFAVIVLLYANYKKKERRERLEELKKEQDKT